MILGNFNSLLSQLIVVILNSFIFPNKNRQKIALQTTLSKTPERSLSNMVLHGL